MAVKFPLKMADGAMVRTLEDLREHFDLTTVLSYYDNGRLVKWLENGYYDEEAKQIAALDSFSDSFKDELCAVLGVNYSENETEQVTLADVSNRNQRLERLKQYTADDSILAKIDCVAFAQDELMDFLKKGIHEVYLFGERFVIPANVSGVTYIGVNRPVVEFQGGTIGADIEIQNVEFDVEDYEDFRDSASPKLYAELVSIKAEQGYMVAQFNLGECYFNGHGVEKNLEQAVSWFRKAAEQGYPAAQYWLGKYYCSGAETNFGQAVSWIRKAAEQGYVDAQYQMGQCYEYGFFGVEKNLEQAVSWYEKAAKQGGYGFAQDDAERIQAEINKAAMINAGLQALELVSSFQNMKKDLKKGFWKSIF